MKKLRIPHKKSRTIFIQSFQGINTTQDPTIIPLNQTSLAYNFCFERGVLQQGFGIDDSPSIAKLPLPNAQVDRVWLYSKRSPNLANILMLSTKDGYIYYRNLDTPNDPFQILDLVKFTSPPSTITYRLDNQDILLLTSPADGIWLWDGIQDIRKIETDLNTTSITLYAERLFVTTPDHPDAIYFSNDLDPTNFHLDPQAGNHIPMTDDRGVPQVCVPYQNYLYIFREYGISRLSTHNSPTDTDFVLTNPFVSSGKIYRSTVCLCGNIILFLASDGIYTFDGITTRKILPNLTGELALSHPQDNAIGGYHNGKYYLAFADKLIILDLSNGNHTISRDLPLSYLYASPRLDQMFAVLNSGEIGQITQNGSVFDNPLRKIWQIGPTDLSDPSTQKHIRSLDIITHYDLTLHIQTPQKSKTMYLQGSPNIQTKPINLTGKQLQITLQSTTPLCHISRPQFKIEI